MRWLLQIATVHLSSRGWQVARQSVAQPFNHAKQLVMLRLSSSHPIGNNFPCHYLHFLYYYYYCCCCCCCCLWWNLFLGLLVLRLSISSLLQSATEQTLERPFMFCENIMILKYLEHPSRLLIQIIDSYNLSDILPISFYPSSR